MQEWFKLSVLALQASIVMQVFAIGLGATWREATFLFRHSRLLWSSILARNVAVPLLAVLLIRAFSFHGPVAITLGVLAVTPVPPLFPKSLREDCRSEYVLGLLVSQAVLAIVLVPLTIQLMDWMLGAQARFRAGQVALVMFRTILLPLTAGMLASCFLPRFRHIKQHLAAIGNILLIAGAIPLLLLAWRALITLTGHGMLLAVTIFIVGSTLAGHLAGASCEHDRTALAIATSARHPGLAIAIAYANYPQHVVLVAGVVVLYLILRIIITLPYLRWRRAAHT